MASRFKRRAVESGVPQPPDPLVQRDDEEEDKVVDEDEGDDDSDEEGDEEDHVIDEEVNIEFEAYSLSDNDYDGIKKLLQQLFLKAPVNTAELTDLLIQQNHIGSVIKQTDVSEDSDDDMDEDEVFGFISLLNLTERKGTQCAEQIQELILSFCEKNCEKSMVEKLDKFLNDTTKPVGLLLSERFINIPPQIALPMYQQLQKELAEAHRTNKPCGKCYFYLLISKTFVEAGKNNSKKKLSNRKKTALMFANAEEEFFYEQEQGKPEVLGGPDTRRGLEPVPIRHNGGSRGRVTALVSLKAGLIQSRSTLSDFQGTFMTVGIALS
ncbi:BRCA2 and CDKN1A-interacting protein isoform X1 [Rhinopithecus roxellana]|uniref:BRCA2 and CDKN1A interacting protein n=2 Tax=Rhinopithecus TaxID=542827 RepID=A0A2K6MUR8_RHIBE|nr:BRCA2 and CDKN1A-interacting protein isoform X1 [Rhinopithecus roxellana]XP_017714122.1 PREDICTED: BRCA2 and CDKN1A-interacting protein isoform X1 [Rhinopithecus bieti]